MNRLPDTSGMKNEVIMPRSHRNFYDHAVRSVGITLVEVGIPDRFSGAGVRDTEAWEIADAITDQTAAIVYVAQSSAQPPLSQVIAVARDSAIPVIVDAAGQLPPAANLQAVYPRGRRCGVFQRRESHWRAPGHGHFVRSLRVDYRSGIAAFRHGCAF